MKQQVVDITKLTYRKCVGIILLNKDNKIFIGKRIDTLDNEYAWQMPQGGVDEGEDYEQAVFRELLEEVGTDKAEIIYKMQKLYRYDIPERFLNRFFQGKHKGQDQQWFVMRFLGNDQDIKIDRYHIPEFSEWCWADIDKVIENVVYFKRQLYYDLMQELKQFLIK